MVVPAGGAFPLPKDNILACMADGTVRMVMGDIPEERLRSLIVRNDGKPDDGWLPDN